MTVFVFRFFRFDLVGCATNCRLSWFCSTRVRGDTMRGRDQDKLSLSFSLFLSLSLSLSLSVFLSAISGRQSQTHSFIAVVCALCSRSCRPSLRRSCCCCCAGDERDERRQVRPGRETVSQRVEAGHQQAGTPAPHPSLQAHNLDMIHNDSRPEFSLHIYTVCDTR